MQNQPSNSIEIAPQNTSLAREYFAWLQKLDQSDDWVSFRIRSVQHLLNCLGEKSVGDLDPDGVIEALCESSTHHRSGQPLSEDRLRHILEHTREFLNWASDRHPALLKGFGYFEMRHWQQKATEANRARGISSASLSPCSHVPPPDVLNLLVWALPTMTLGEIYGISDVAFGKWCKKARVQKPPRGFWAKCQARIWDAGLEETLSALSQSAVAPDQLVIALLPHKEKILARRRAIESC